MLKKRPRETFYALALPFVIISLTFNNDCQAKITKEKGKKNRGSVREIKTVSTFLTISSSSLLSLVFCYSKEKKQQSQSCKKSQNKGVEWSARGKSVTNHSVFDVFAVQKGDWR